MNDNDELHHWTRALGSGRIGALALLAALAMAGCMTAEDEPELGEAASNIESEYYRCVSPMCGGVDIMFDSRDLQLRSCTLNTKDTLVCEARREDSPEMPTAFWKASAELVCDDGLSFTCTNTRDTTSCECTKAAAGSSKTNTAHRIWIPAR